ncbi:hypothetical protein BDQ17DRAFT_1359737 [Cyathus striatus]|nr:hypothetical protein BDQ17DRAFT_1359737 [Cyathus striatus]
MRCLSSLLTSMISPPSYAHLRSSTPVDCNGDILTRLSLRLNRSRTGITIPCSRVGGMLHDQKPLQVSLYHHSTCTSSNVSTGHCRRAPGCT